MIRRLTFLLIACLSVAVPASSAVECLPYGPAQVTLSGKLQRLAFPGRPNYESIVDGDEPEAGFYLALRKAVCTVGSANSADSYPQQGVTLVQLVLDKQGNAQLRPYLGRRIELTGALFAQHTAHHHAPLLLQNVVHRGSER